MEVRSVTRNNKVAEMRLYDRRGQRLYLNAQERLRLLETASEFDLHTSTLCGTLCLTGCRLSEALALTKSSIDVANGSIVIESLKKRSRYHFRAIPVPGYLIAELSGLEGNRLWPMARTTAWRRVKEVMKRAGVNGPYASPKGLRHGFGVSAIQAGVPLNLVQKWLGHAQISTTAIYANALGPEERAIAERMWRTTPVNYEDPQKK